MVEYKQMVGGILVLIIAARIVMISFGKKQITNNEVFIYLANLMTGLFLIS